MKKTNKFLSVVLALIMMLSVIPISNITAFATDDEPLTIEVTTDKSSYKATGKAEITVTITNTSEEAVNNVRAEAVFEQLTPIKKNSNETYKEVDSLQSDESITLKYKAMLNADEVKVGFFDKIGLWFVKLFNSSYTATNHNIDAIIEKTTEIKFGKYIAENIIKVGYAPNFDISNMEETVSQVTELLSSDEYQNKEESEKVNLTKNLLLELEANGLIEENSITYNDETKYYHFRITSGAMVSLSIENEEEFSYPWLTPIGTTNNNINYQTNQTETIISATSSSSADENIDSIIMYGFDEPEKKERSLDDWTSLCDEKTEMNTKILDCPTVQKFKTSLLNNDFITIFEHGDYGNIVDQAYTFVVQDEAVNSKTLLLYASDLNDDRVVLHIQGLGKAEFAITPRFFEHYYKNKFNDTIVWLMSCQSFGEAGIVDYGIADVLIEKCGAETVLGFDDSVSQAYGYYAYDEITDLLVKGFNIGEAYNLAIKKLGSTDREFLIEQSKTIEDPEMKQKYIEAAKNEPARLLFYGDETTRLVELSELNGLVVESLGASNEPLANVTVTAENANYKISGKTDENGKFTLKLPLGTYEISLSLDNYTSSPTTITVDENTSNQVPYLLFMEKSSDDTDSELSSVHGFVIDKDTREPISNMKVMLYSENTQETLSTLTNENGEFSFEEIDVGSYTLSFEHEDYLTNRTSTFALTEGVMFVYTEPFEFTKRKSSGDEGGDTTDPDREVTASGECGADGDNLTWILYSDGELVISGSGEMKNYDSFLFIYTPWHVYNSNIKKVVVSDGVTSIGSEAFDYCASLISITIPDSVTLIGSSAFSGCDSLTSVTIPDSVTSIGSGAFHNTAYYNNTSNWGNDVLYIGNHLIEAKTEILGDYEIIDGTITIGSSAFSGCDSLTSVTIPDSVTSIGDSAFYECTSLVSVTIPDSVTSIGDSAFYECTSLVSVTIPDSIISIGKDAFEDCDSLISVTIPDSVISIGKDAFEGCDSLISVTIGNNVTSVGEYAFEYCISLESVYISDMTAWCNIDFVGYMSNPLDNGADLYLKGEKVTDLIIPDSVTLIDEYTFKGCTSLTSVIIPDSVISIDEGAFCYCSSLTSITVDSNNEYYSSDEYGVLFNKDKTTLIQYPKGNTRTSYTIPDSVTSISSFAFYNCVYLASITIPDSVTSIGDYVFYNGELINAYYIGTEEQWNEIAIGSYNWQLNSSTIHYIC